MLIGGGQVSSYDGVRTVENNFSLYPERISATGTQDAPITAINDVVVYNWTDAQGSSTCSLDPSLRRYLLMSTGSTVRATFLRLTKKVNVRIELYRTI